MKVIIPARGGSKRIPNKNIKELNGKPLISYAIETSLSVTDDVFVSTDSIEIADVAERYGAFVVKRPSHLATDVSRTEDSIEHFLDIVDGVNEFACVQATTPMLTGEDLKSGFDTLREYDYDSVISVVERAEYLWDHTNKPINFTRYGRPRTQKLSKTFSENGAFYVTTKKTFEKNKCLYDGSVCIVVMSELSSLEIDTEEDWNLVSKCMS